MPPLTGGRGSPWIEDPPPLLEKWTLTVKKRCCPSRVSQTAPSGFRLSSHALLVGSINPGLYFSSPPERTTLASVLDPVFPLRSRTTDGS